MKKKNAAINLMELLSRSHQFETSPHITADERHQKLQIFESLEPLVASSIQALQPKPQAPTACPIKADDTQVAQPFCPPQVSPRGSRAPAPQPFTGRSVNGPTFKAQARAQLSSQALAQLIRSRPGFRSPIIRPKPKA